MGRRSKQPPVEFVTPRGTWPAGPFTRDTPTYVQPLAHLALELTKVQGERQLTQHDLATLTGVNVATINHILAGKVIPDTATLAQLETTLNKDLWFNNR